MFTSDSQHPPRSKHAVYLGVYDNKGFGLLGDQGQGPKCHIMRYFMQVWILEMDLTSIDSFLVVCFAIPVSKYSKICHENRQNKILNDKW